MVLISCVSQINVLTLTIDSISLSALFDSESTINIDSSKFYDCVGSSFKSDNFTSSSSNVSLAKNQHVNIIVAAKIRMQIIKKRAKYIYFVLVSRAHPLILEKQFLMSLGLMLHFKFLCVYTNLKLEIR